MKALLMPGLRFHGNQIVETLNKLNIKPTVCSTAKRSQWRGDLDYKFCPMPFTILQRVTGILRTTYFKELDAKFYDKYCSLLAADNADIVHGLATFSLKTATTVKTNSGRFYLERACPHLTFQNKLLSEESDFLGIPFKPSSQEFMDRSLEEYSLADKIIVPSEYSLSSFISLGFPHSKLVKAPINSNFKVDFPKIASLKDSNCMFKVGFVGGNVVRKGLVYLVDAWTKLNLSNAKLLLKISPAELKRVPNLYEKICSNSSIEIIPYVDDMEDFYKQCDVFCLPSIDDGFGMVVMEALACGTPVITTTNVGASEWLLDTKYNHVVAIKDSDALAEAILTYYSDKNYLFESSCNANCIHEDFTKSCHHLSSMKAIYLD